MLSGIRTSGRPRPGLIGILLFSMLVAACGGSASAPGAGPGGAPIADENAGGEGNPNPATNGEDGAGGETRGLYANGQANLLIIKTGSLVLQVAGIDAAISAATQQITALGGYVSGSERSGDQEFDQATITFRVPAGSWDQALAGLRGLATKVLGERAVTEDVTSQVVDLGARIRNLETTEAALQGIMDRAVDIEDVLAVQAELTTVRGQIEQLTAQKTHLEAQAAMSTLSVTFSLKPDPVLTSTEQFDPASEVDRAAASLVGVLQGIATAGIWFAIVWLPILLVLAIIAGIGAFMLRRFRRGGSLPPAAAASSGDAGTQPG